MDEMELEALLAPLDDVRQTPPDTADRVLRRVLAADRAEVEIEPVEQADGQGRRRWPLLVGVIAATALVVLGIATFRGRQDSGLATTGDPAVTTTIIDLDVVCADLSDASDGFRLLQTDDQGPETITTDQLTSLRPGLERFVAALPSLGVEPGVVQEWRTLSLTVAQAERDARVGDQTSAAQLMSRVQIDVVRLAFTDPDPALVGCFS